AWFPIHCAKENCVIRIVGFPTKRLMYCICASVQMQSFRFKMHSSSLFTHKNESIVPTEPQRIRTPGFKSTQPYCGSSRIFSNPIFFRASTTRGELCLWYSTVMRFRSASGIDLSVGKLKWSGCSCEIQMYSTRSSGTSHEGL